MSECKNALICPKCESSEVYFENPSTGSGKYTCQDCEFMGNEQDFNYSIPAKEYKELESQIAVMRGALEYAKTYKHQDITDILTEVKACSTANYDAELLRLIASKARQALSTIPVEASQKLQELEKFAELGRLAIEAINAYSTTVYDSKPCEGSYNSLGNGEVCGQCNWLMFCQKRAEILAGEKHD